MLPTSMSECGARWHLRPLSTATLLIHTGRRPTFRRQNSPFHRSLMNACCLETFEKGSFSFPSMTVPKIIFTIFATRQLYETEVPLLLHYYSYKTKEWGNAWWANGRAYITKT